jgi:hypothetical protein
MLVVDVKGDDVSTGSEQILMVTSGAGIERVPTVICIIDVVSLM